MKQRLVYAVLAAFAIALPAAAEPQRLAQNFSADSLPSYEIITIVRSAGLDPLGPPVRRGTNYVLHAIGGDDREVRVLVDARSGGILSITPVRTASQALPRGGVAMGPYERMPPGYIPAEPPGGYRAGPPVEYEDEPPVAYGMRPPAAVPGGAPLSREAAPPRVITATPNGDDVASADEPIIEPRSGMLPPPPERFPQRAAPVTTAKPKPVKRAAAAVPKQAPLPRPRPPSAAGASPPMGNIDAPPVPPLVPETKPAATQVPN